MNKAWLKYLVVFLLCCSVSARAQVMWPGDVNNNGVVNGADVLYLGLAYGRMGPQRVDGSEEWTPQNITTLWGTTFPGGPDYAYADCNGDGLVDENDLDGAIEENFGLTHGIPAADGYVNGMQGIDPGLFLEPEMERIDRGAAVNIGLRLGTADFPIENFYGIALKISYTGDILDEDADEEGFDFDLGDDTWVGAGDDDTVDYLFVKDNATGQAELAITRLDQQVVQQGEGLIGQFSIVVEDIIVGSPSDTFAMRIDSVLFFDDLLNKYAMTPDTAQVIVGGDTSSTTSSSDLAPAPRVRMYPNPAVDHFWLESERPIEYLRVLNTAGQPMPLPALPGRSGRLLISTARWPRGLYFVKLYADERKWVRKLAILSP